MIMHAHGNMHIYTWYSCANSSRSALHVRSFHTYMFWFVVLLVICFGAVHVQSQALFAIHGLHSANAKIILHSTINIVLFVSILKEPYSLLKRNWVCSLCACVHKDVLVCIWSRYYWKQIIVLTFLAYSEAVHSITNSSSFYAIGLFFSVMLIKIACAADVVINIPSLSLSPPHLLIRNNNNNNKNM